MRGKLEWDKVRSFYIGMRGIFWEKVVDKMM